MSAKQNEAIKLFVIGGGWGVPFASSAPFPLKLETWLRMSFRITVGLRTR